MKKILFLMVILSLVACHGKRGGKHAEEGKKKESKPPLVEVADVTRGKIRHVTNVTATLEAEREVNIVSETMGIVEKILTEEGKLVHESEVIATLRHRDEEVALEKAIVEHEHQKTELERNKKLYDQGLLSPEAIAQTEYLFNQARVVLEDARMRLEKTSIVAPFTGVIAKRHIHVGQHVQALTPLFSITDSDPLLTRIYLPEETAVAIKVGDSVEGYAREGEIVFHSKVLRISPVVDSQTGTVEIVLSVVDKIKDLKPGSFVTFDVVDKVKQETVLVPIRALASELDQNWVFTVNDNEAHKVDVKIGWRNGTVVEILEGVEPGQRVVTVGKEGLKDGTKVVVAGEEPPEEPEQKEETEETESSS